MSDLPAAFAATVVAVATTFAAQAADEPDGGPLRARLARLADAARSSAFDRATARAVARFRSESSPATEPLLALLADQRPAAARLQAAAVEELLLAGEPDLARLVDLYRRDLRVALAAAGDELPPWRLLGPALLRLVGDLLPQAMNDHPRLQPCLPDADERAVLDRMRADRAAPLASLAEHPGQSIIATNGAAITHVQQTFVSGDLYAAPAAHLPDLTLLFMRYKAFVAESFGALDFRGILQLQAATRIGLEQIYVPAQGREDHAGRGTPAPIASLHDIVREQPLLVVLGDPGSGKSTLVRYLLLTHTRGDPRSDFGLEPTWLPIFFPVAAFARARAQPGRGDLSPRAYLTEYYLGLSQPDYGPLFLRALTLGRALVLLDGLDEVRDDRRAVVRALEAFAREWDALGNRFVATSRVVGYDEAALDPALFAVVTIQPFTDEQIHAFIERWSRAYATLSEPAFPPEGDLLNDLMREASALELERRVEEWVRSLSAAVFAEPHVTDLARTPLLLTILALIHNQGARLPERRVDLYRLCVEALAETWNRARSLTGRPIDVQLGDEPIDERFVINLLGPVALWIHEENPGGLVDQDELEARIGATLVQTDGIAKRRARRLAQDFIDLMRRDTGLLLERGYRRFAFLHLTFEEYLAARGLLESVTVDEPDSLLRRYAADARWREVLRLAVAAAPQREAQRLLLTLIAAPADDDERGRPVVLAGECLLDIGRNSATGRAWSAVVAALLDLVSDPAPRPATRVAGGAVLGRLGDPRLLNPDTGKAEGCHEGQQPADYWCSVAAGPCFHGEGRDRRGRGAALRQVELPQGFRIARYPVTNMEYGRFIAAHGYAEPRWWTPAGWAFVSQAGQSEMAEESSARITRAALWGVSPYDGPTQPVVGVSWYEAAAYCAWLTERGRAAGWLYHGEILRLPTALEWERAARHSDQRSYPWGDEAPDAGRANFEETGLRAPTPVGCFPAGAAVCGALDLAGNVWEWTASLADELDSLVPRGEIAEGQMPAIKGGAFNWAGEALRCGAHYWFHPSQRYNLLGFRLVWVARDGGAE